MSDPAAPLPDDYPRFLEQLKTQVRHARIRASRAANTELLTLYWHLGHAIRQRQQSHGWGAKVIDQLAQICGPSSRTCADEAQRRCSLVLNESAHSWAGSL